VGPLSRPRTAGSTWRQKENDYKTLFRKPQNAYASRRLSFQSGSDTDDSEVFVFPCQRSGSEKMKKSVLAPKLSKADQKRIIKICRAQRKEARDARTKREYAGAYAAWRTREGCNYDRLPAETEEYVVQHPHALTPYCTLCDAAFNPQHTLEMWHKKNLVLYGLDHLWVVFERKEDETRIGEWVVKKFEIPQEWVSKKPKESLSIPTAPWLLPKTKLEQFVVDHNKDIWKKKADEKNKKKKALKEKEKKVKEKESEEKEKESEEKEGSQKKNTCEGRREGGACEYKIDEEANANPREQDSSGKSGFIKKKASRKARKEEARSRKSGLSREEDSCSGDGVPRFKSTEDNALAGPNALSSREPKRDPTPQGECEKNVEWARADVGRSCEDDMTSPPRWSTLEKSGTSGTDHPRLGPTMEKFVAHVSPSHAPRCSEDDDDKDDQSVSGEWRESSALCRCPPCDAGIDNTSSLVASYLGCTPSKRTSVATLDHGDGCEMVETSGANILSPSSAPRCSGDDDKDDQSVSGECQANYTPASGNDKKISSNSSSISSRSIDDDEDEEELSSNAWSLFPGLQEDDDDDEDDEESVGVLWSHSTKWSQGCPRTTKVGENLLLPTHSPTTLDQNISKAPHDVGLLTPNKPFRTVKRTSVAITDDGCKMSDTSVANILSPTSSSKQTPEWRETKLGESNLRLPTHNSPPTLDQNHGHDGWKSSYCPPKKDKMIWRKKMVSSKDEQVYQGITVAKVSAPTNSRLPPMEGWMHVGPAPFTVSREVTSKSSGSSE